MTITRLWLGLSLIAALLLAWNMAAHATCRSVYDTSRNCDPREFLSFYASPTFYMANRAELRAALLSCQNGNPHPRGWCEAAYQAARTVGAP